MGPGECPQLETCAQLREGEGVSSLPEPPSSAWGSLWGEREPRWSSLGARQLAGNLSTAGCAPWAAVTPADIPVVHQRCVDRARSDREEGQQLLLQALQRALQGEAGAVCERQTAVGTAPAPRRPLTPEQSPPAAPWQIIWMPDRRKAQGKEAAALSSPRGREESGPCQVCVPRAGIIPHVQRGSSQESFVLLLSFSPP